MASSGVKSNCVEVDRRLAGLKAGATRATACGGYGLDPVRSPVLEGWHAARSGTERSGALAQLSA